MNNNIEIINKLQDYMFTSDNLTRIINNFEPKVEIKKRVFLLIFLLNFALSFLLIVLKCQTFD